MTQMNLLPNAEPPKEIKARNGTRNGDARQSQEADGVQQSDASAKLNGAVDPALIASLFGRFQESEEQNKNANEKKAAIYADAKAEGLDAGALRVAFRQRARELEKPEVSQKHDALNSLTRSYLDALRSDRAAAEQDDALRPAASCDPSQACPKPLARSRARERASKNPFGEER
jgi:hypothetical protein